MNSSKSQTSPEALCSCLIRHYEWSDYPNSGGNGITWSGYNGKPDNWAIIYNWRTPDPRIERCVTEGESGGIGWNVAACGDIRREWCDRKR